ncbi:hypothetical protein AB0N38_28600 [Micromonospora aurantiaca]|uniref:Transposase n=1 Tax=Micromonospora aurantiaca (nom. illeg.) TaxID=47850 RepID=A0ABQ6UN37_9ACTN|nr:MULTISPECIES: hypothetical protein [Micromonospora]KAB1118682.1 hypothetical protein F6X54_02890 [Micromonospora aurantiaca]MBC8994800.1 hypothetical protein [Micromonospora chalcea]MCT2281108.1 hypothetical protein [Micromonospora chalcea]MDG4752756.1 hypothetical protein [Micromonospora sp. WMMD718]UFN92560.1 hypothetical protein LF814_21435 [Micromonospora aurantiaca]
MEMKLAALVTPGSQPAQTAGSSTFECRRGFDENQPNPGGRRKAGSPPCRRLGARRAKQVGTAYESMIVALIAVARFKIRHRGATERPDHG